MAVINLFLIMKTKNNNKIFTYNGNLNRVYINFFFKLEIEEVKHKEKGLTYGNDNLPSMSSSFQNFLLENFNPKNTLFLLSRKTKARKTKWKRKCCCFLYYKKKQTKHDFSTKFCKTKNSRIWHFLSRIINTNKNEMNRREQRGDNSIIVSYISVYKLLI